MKNHTNDCHNMAVSTQMELHTAIQKTMAIGGDSKAVFVAVMDCTKQDYKKLRSKTQQEIQKQIEAVRGLIGVYNSFRTTTEHLSMGLSDDLDLFEDKLKDLTATLKPHLKGEKLEV